MGSLHCVACTDTGEVYTWGDNDEGQLGDGTTNAIPRPRLVTALQVARIILKYVWSKNCFCRKLKATTSSLRNKIFELAKSCLK